MKKFFDAAARLYAAARYALGRYPAAYGVLLNIAVVVIGYFGLNVTGEQLIYLIGVVSAFVGAYIHARVTPVSGGKGTEK